MSTAPDDRSIEIACQIDGLEEATIALVDVALMRAGGGADGVDAALRSALREIGVVIHELGGAAAMQAVMDEASVDAAPKDRWRADYIRRAWRGVGRGAR